VSENQGRTPEMEEKDRKVREVLDRLLTAYRTADPDLGERSAHLPMYEILEWKGRANIWNPTLAEFREGVAARKEEPMQQETLEEAIEWLSEVTALVFRKVRTSLADGRTFVTPAFFVVVPDREGTVKVAVSWWGAFPDWFVG
jgi:hypothetical protein